MTPARTGPTSHVRYQVVALATTLAMVTYLDRVYISKLAPDIPTFIDGGVKGFTAESYIGILAPAKTPADVIAKVEKAVQDGLKPGSPAAERLAQLGAEVATPEQMTAKGFAAFIATDYENMKQAAKLADIKPQ